jgi:hypothetical protein
MGLGLYPPVFFLLSTSAETQLPYIYQRYQNYLPKDWFFVVLPSSATHRRCRGYFHLITLKHTPQSVGLLWTRDRPVAEASTWQHKHCTRDKHPCPGGIRTHDPSKRSAADLRLRPCGQWDRQDWFLRCHTLASYSVIRAECFFKICTFPNPFCGTRRSLPYSQ